MSTSQPPTTTPTTAVDRQQQHFADNVKEVHTRYMDHVISQLGYSFTGTGGIRVPANSKSLTFPELIKEILAHMQRDLASNMVARPFLIGYWEAHFLPTYKREVVNRIFKQTLQETAFEPTAAVGGQLELKRFVNCLLANPQPEDYMVFHHFIWQVKRKMRQLPVTYHLMPIIWGKQESGKSTAVRDYFLRPVNEYLNAGLTFKDLGDSRFYKQLQDYYVVFFDEMAKVEIASIDSIKKVITDAKLPGRVLGTHETQEYSQNSTFIGCSNRPPSDLIQDETGMRRFHYMQALDKCDWATLATIDVNKIWAAVDEMANTPTWYLEHQEKLRQHQEENRFVSAIELFLQTGVLVPGAVGSTTFNTTKAYQLFVEFCEGAGYKNIVNRYTFVKRLQQSHGFVKVREGEDAWNREARQEGKFYGVLLANPKGLNLVVSKQLLDKG